MKVTEIQVSYKRPEKIWNEKICSSKIITEVLRSFWDENTIELIEEFYIILLDTSNEVIGYRCVSRGGLTQTVVDPKIVFSVALKCAATQIILAHNHPSGSLKPSGPDIELTRKLIKCAQFLEIKILDHIIITKDSYYSFADEYLI